MTDPSPLDDFRRLATAAPPDRSAAIAATAAREAQLIKPPGALGRLEEIAAFLAAVTGRTPPQVKRPRIVVFAASHGIVDEGVSAFPSSVNAHMLAAFRDGKAAINQICGAYGIGLSVFDLAVEVPSGNIAREDAFESERALAATMAFGLEAIANEVDCLGIGEMGIGNTAVAAAIYAALYGGGAEAWCGMGSGATGALFDSKVAAVARALERVGPVTDPFVVLQRLGGREIAAMAGAILAARSQGVPVVVDGFVATAAAAVVAAMDRAAIDHCLFAHRSAEAQHRRALDAMGVRPLLELDMRLGEGTGAALAIGIVQAAAACHAGMATFAEAGITGDP